jgi:Protein of unknown function (DUF1572)
MNTTYLSSAVAQFNAYRSLGEKAMAQMQNEMLFWQYNPESNSVAIIVKHLAGNMLSRWTDIFNTDGEKEWRNRDAEFVNDVSSREDLMAVWEKGWNCLFDALNSLQESDLQKIIYIRNEPHIVMDAINRQLTHYASHIGQIVYIGKMVNNEKWNSLSIPRNRSADFNNEMFSKSRKS